MQLRLLVSGNNQSSAGNWLYGHQLLPKAFPIESSVRFQPTTETFCPNTGTSCNSPAAWASSGYGWQLNAPPAPSFHQARAPVSDQIASSSPHTAHTTRRLHSRPLKRACAMRIAYVLALHFGPLGSEGIQMSIHAPCCSLSPAIGVSTHERRSRSRPQTCTCA